MPPPRRIVGVLVWAVIILGIIPAASLGNLIAEHTQAPLTLVLFLGLVIIYVVGVSALILLLDTAARRLFARLGWQYEDPRQS